MLFWAPLEEFISPLPGPSRDFDIPPRQPLACHLTGGVRTQLTGAEAASSAHIRGPKALSHAVCTGYDAQAVDLLGMLPS